MALAMGIVFPRGVRLKLALTLIGGALLVIAPITIRNAVVFGRFIPVSLGGGQTLLEGIADYDSTGRFGVPATDMELIRQEAEAHQRPDYASTLFGPDAIQRDRERTARGWAIVRAHPLWFLTVMVRRAADMWRLERVPLISTESLASGWTRYVYLAVFASQRLFVTAVFLPLVLFGLALLAIKKQHHVLTLLMIVPVYYFSVQSLLHTEYRYVLTLHYFLFVLAAVAIYELVCRARQLLTRGRNT